MTQRRVCTVPSCLPTVVDTRRLMTAARQWRCPKQRSVPAKSRRSWGSSAVRFVCRGSLTLERWMNGCLLSCFQSLFLCNPPARLHHPDPAHGHLLLLLYFDFLTAKILCVFHFGSFIFPLVQPRIPLGWCWCEQLSPQWQTPEIKLGPCSRPGPSMDARLPFSLSLLLSLCVFIPFSFPLIPFSTSSDSLSLSL